MEDHLMGERGEETTNVFAAAQESTAIGGEEEMLLMVPERDTPGHKRSAPDYGQLDEHELANMKRRKKNPNPPPPKKLNNEQWDLMFERLVEYKRQHGVSSFARYLRIPLFVSLSLQWHCLLKTRISYIKTNIFSHYHYSPFIFFRIVLFRNVMQRTPNWARGWKHSAFSGRNCLVRKYPKERLSLPIDV